MSPRLAPVLAASMALLVAACTAGAPTGSGPTFDPARSVAPTPRPLPTHAPVSLAPALPAATPIIGDVVGKRGGPELTVEPVGGAAMQVTLEDAAAKAWRLTVAGVGEHGGDRWEIAVETGDVGPSITATEIVDGKTVDVMDLSGFVDGTAAAGGCHSTLPVCLDSDGFRLPDNGDGRFSVRLQLPDAHTPLTIRGATAAWDGQPFVLGPWHTTEAFPWGEG